MGLIRGGTLTLISILLFVALLASNVFFTMSNSLEFETLQPEISEIATEIVTEQIDVDIQAMQIFCSDVNNTKFDLIYELGLLSIPCETVFEGRDAIILHSAEEAVQDAYFREYNCSFWKCGSVDPTNSLVHISERAKDYWNGWFWIFLVISFALIIFMLFVIEDKRRLPFLVGGLVVIASLPLLVINWLIGLLGVFEFSEVISVYFTKSGTTFVTAFATGVIIFCIGFVLKFVPMTKKK